MRGGLHAKAMGSIPSTTGVRAGEEERKLKCQLRKVNLMKRSNGQE